MNYFLGQFKIGFAHKISKIYEICINCVGVLFFDFLEMCRLKFPIIWAASNHFCAQYMENILKRYKCVGGRNMRGLATRFFRPQK